MPCYADLASDLLNEAANFFVRVTQNRPDILPQMEENAATFRQMAGLIKNDPDGAVEHLTHGEMAGRLLEDAALFFISIGQENPPIQEQMEQNATIFKHLAQEVRANPSAPVPEPTQETQE